MTSTSDVAEEKPSSYKQYVKIQSHRRPCLQNLNEFLVEPDHTKCSAGESRIKVLSYCDSPTPTVENLEPKDLRNVLVKGFYGLEKVRGRMIIVENASANTVETLGAHLDVNPLFFASHLHAPSPGVKSQTPQSALLPSQIRGLDFISCHYHRILSFERLPHVIPKQLFRECHYLRKVVLLPPTRGVRIGMSQHSCSISKLSHSPTSWLCKFGGERILCSQYRH